MRELTMSKKRRPDNRIERQPDVRTEDEVKPRRYVPRPCAMCTALRDGESYSFVNGTETRINSETELIISRSCKCRKCGNTWTEYTIVKH